MRDIEHFIGGRSVAGTSGRHGEVFDPNAGRVQARVALADAAELDRAVASAVEGQRAWAQVNPQRRARVLFEFKRLLERDMDALALRLGQLQAELSPFLEKENPGPLLAQWLAV